MLSGYYMSQQPNHNASTSVLSYLIILRGQNLVNGPKFFGIKQLSTSNVNFLVSTSVDSLIITSSYSNSLIMTVFHINSLISSVLVQGDPLHCDVSRIIINWNMINNTCS